MNTQTTRRFAQVPCRAAQPLGLGVRALRIFIAICAHVNGEGKAWPSLETLSRITGIDRRAVSKEIKAIEGAGLIRTEGRQQRNGAAASNLYTILFDDG